MAVASTSSRKINVADEEKAKKIRSNGQAVRVVGERIYDPQNGKTCHQCRHKRMDFGPSCTSIKGNKECLIRLCHKCLLNRYGEKTEEVAILNDWECPKCRGICNCSKCMKRRGQKPTGILIHIAKQNGFSVSSVRPENMGDYKMENAVDASPVKSSCPKKELMVVSPRKPGKENSFNGNIDSKLDSHNTSPLSKKKKKSKKTKREGVEELSNVNKDDDATLKKSGHKKCGISEEASKNEVSSNGKDESHSVKIRNSKKRKRGGLKEVSNDNNDDDACLNPSGHKKCRIPEENEVNANGKDEGHSVKKRKSKNTKTEGLEKVSNGKGDDDASLNRISEEVSKNEVNSYLKDEGHSVKKRKSKKTKKGKTKGS